MQEPYPEDTYTQEPYSPPPQARRTMSPWLIVLIVVLALLAVCCLCACLVLTLGGPVVGNTFSTIIETLEATTPMP